MRFSSLVKSAVVAGVALSTVALPSVAEEKKGIYGSLSIGVMSPEDAKGKIELLANEIASSVVDQCGYPLNLSGEKGIIEFKISNHVSSLITRIYM